MKRISAPLVILFLCLSGLNSESAHAASDAYDPLLTVTGGPGGVVEYVVEGGAVDRNGYLGIDPGSVSSSSDSRTWQWCASLQDKVCNPSNFPQRLKAMSVLPPCMSNSQENCIESLEIGNSTAIVKARLIRLTNGITFEPDPKYDYIGSSTISLWSIPESFAGGGSATFALDPKASAYLQNGKFRVADFSAEVVPYREAHGDQYKQQRIDTSTNATPEHLYTYSRYAQTCVFEEDGICGVAQDFAPDTRIRLVVRLTKQVGGWFHGRLKDPVLDVQDFSATSARITVDAASVTVPRMAYVANRANFNEKEKVAYQNMGYWPTLDDGNGSGAQAGNPWDSLPFIEYYRAKVKDTAIATNTFWNLSTVATGAGSNCFQDKSKLLGMVTTNAMAYDGGSPSYDDGVLNYRVAGLHFMPDGVTPVRGTYSLLMRSEVARCLYGLTPAPIKATISIVGGNDSVVATTSMGERNGWLSLSAAGFTFSEKNIQVKLSQDAPVATPVVAPTMAPATVPATKPVAKAITITCVKGKTTKKVTASKPVCPKGYTKK